MADTNWQDFPDGAPQAADIYVAMRGAGGVNSTMAQMAAFAAANAGDGAVAAPGMAFASDPDTGIYRQAPNVMGFVAGGTERLRVGSYGASIQSGSFGIGIVPNARLHVYNAGFVSAIIEGDGTSQTQLIFKGNTATNIFNQDSTPILFTNPSGEIMRLSADRNVGIGTGSPGDKLHVHKSNADHFLKVSTNAATYACQVNIDRGSTNQTYIGASAGSTGIGIFSNENLPIAFSNNGFQTRLVIESGGHTRPGGDNLYALGGPSFRWTGVHAATGSINTSDELAKREIGSIPEEWLDAWGAVDWVRYKFRDAVEAKGDGARWHVGLIAQRVRDAFAEAGLDALAIGLLCYDKWEEQREPVYEEQVVDTATVVVGQAGTGIVGPDGAEIMRDVTEEQDVRGRVQVGERVTLEAGDRWGLRYDECQAMEAAWQRRELARKDALIADLANRLAALEAA
ncbi:tail fiber domain-containing protein [Sphingobium agri]|uniref:Tail fiber domain-containing protein n=1 Tax=Sphingobium agri TaxID=2933566 RepID=A0ABT0E210_9SPHN|nr:tail fiber domain-containing protein [Sphingobium agri]MCK0533395.1 tail fiber domain-containing protein [Sphingobium agri]